MGSRNEVTVGLLFGFKEATEMHGIHSFPETAQPKKLSMISTETC